MVRQQYMKIPCKSTWTIVTYVVMGFKAVYAIVGGKYASEGDYPFAIVILKEDKVICGGVLVTHEHIFTGCHCVGKWSETPESSSVVWEPDQTAYDFNFSTPDSDDRKNLDGRAGGQISLQITTSPRTHLDGSRNMLPTTPIQRTEHSDNVEGNSSYEPQSSGSSKNLSIPTSAPLRVSVNQSGWVGNNSSSSDQIISTENPFRFNTSATRFSLTTLVSQVHYMRRRDADETTTDGNITTNGTTADASTTIDVSTSTVATTTTTTTTIGTTEKNTSSPTPGNTTASPLNEKFNPFSLGDVYVVGGTVWIYKFSRGQLRKAGNSFKHPRCSAKTTPWDYDFGIYRVSAAFVFNERRLYPMKIYHEDNEIFRRRFQLMIEGGTVCHTIGWGATQLLYNSDPHDNTFNRSAVNMSEKLKYTEVKLVTDELCNQLLCFPPYNFCNGSGFQWAEVGIVCAIHVSRGDSCDIDDGNALICDGHVFGFANSGLDCMSNIPRFYTRLDYALDFYYSSVVNLGISSNFIIHITFSVVMVIFIFIKPFI